MNKNYKKIKQKGIVLLTTLISLVILIIGSIALVRSVDTSQTISGNIAFKRDLTNEGERGMNTAIVALKTGSLASATTRQTSSTALNYSSSILPTTLEGIPTAMLMNSSDTDYSSYGNTANDIVDNTAHVTVRYLIDRLCLSSGASSSLNCSTSLAACDLGGDANAQKACASDPIVYRISVRVIGPRNRVAFYQSTMSLAQ